MKLRSYLFSHALVTVLPLLAFSGVMIVYNGPLWRRLGLLLVVGAVPSMQVSPLFLLMGCRSIKGWYSGTSIDTQDTLAFSARTAVRPMSETFPLERGAEAYDRMMSGKARFRVVLVTGS